MGPRVFVRSGALLATSLLIAACDLLDIHSSRPLVSEGATTDAGTSSGGPTCPTPGPAVLSGLPIVDVAVDEEDVFFVAGTEVGKMPLATPGLSQVQSLAQSPDNAFRIGINATSVYWSYNGGAAEGAIPTLSVIAKDGTVAQPIVTTALGGAVFAQFLAVDAKGVYYSSTDGSIRSVRTGTAPLLVSALDTVNITQGLAPVGETLYYTSTDQGRVMSVASSGSESQVIVSGLNAPGPLAADGQNVYWLALGSNGAVMQAPIGGGEPVQLCATGPNPNAIAVDSAEVYWNDGDVVAYVPIGGGAVTYLGCGSNLTRVFVSRTSVYWLEGDGTLRSAPKPGPIAPPPDAGPTCDGTGIACAQATDCCSGTCDSTTKVCDACFASQMACAADSDCCTGFCAGGYPDPSFCSCRPEGYDCTESSTCCTGECLQGICNVSSTCTDVGQYCGAAPCCAPSVCEKTQQVPVATCCLPPGADCSQNSQACCDQVTCENGKCT